MTAIAYYNGMIVGDNQHLSLSLPIQKKFGDKVFVSQCKTFAYGFSGTSVNKTIQPLLEAFIQKAIEYLTLHQSDKINSKDIDPEFQMNLDHGVVMTKSESFVFRLYGGEGNIVRNNVDIAHGCGSGGIVLASLLLVDTDPYVAMEMVNSVDPLTGTEATVIKASSLKQFILRG